MKPDHHSYRTAFKIGDRLCANKNFILIAAIFSLPPSRPARCWLCRNSCPARVLGRDGDVAPSERIVLGGIGIGNRGTYDLGCFLEEPDVQLCGGLRRQSRAPRAIKKKADDKYGNQDCATYRDLRELLARSDIDAVLIATGPNWHATAATLAANAGKDVYCEKPCTKNIAQSLALAETFRRTGRVFQAGTQRRSLPNFVFAIDLARRGKLGKLKTLYAHPIGLATKTQRLGCRPNPSRTRKSWIGICISVPRRGVPSTRRCWMDSISRKAAAWSAAAASNGARIASTSASGPTTPTTPRRSNTNRRAGELHARYANGVKLVLRDDGWLPLGSCPVRFEGDTGWVETGDDAAIWWPVRRRCWWAKAPRSAGYPANFHIRDFLDCVKIARPRPAPTPTPPARRTSPVTRPISRCSSIARFSMTP